MDLVVKFEAQRVIGREHQLARTRRHCDAYGEQRAAVHVPSDARRPETGEVGQFWASSSPPMP